MVALLLTDRDGRAGDCHAGPFQCRLGELILTQRVGHGGHENLGIGALQRGRDCPARHADGLALVGRHPCLEVFVAADRQITVDFLVFEQNSGVLAVLDDHGLRVVAHDLPAGHFLLLDGVYAGVQVLEGDLARARRRQDYRIDHAVRAVEGDFPAGQRAKPNRAAVCIGAQSVLLHRDGSMADRYMVLEDDGIGSAGSRVLIESQPDDGRRHRDPVLLERFLDQPGAGSQGHKRGTGSVGSFLLYDGEQVARGVGSDVPVLTGQDSAVLLFLPLDDSDIELAADLEEDVVAVVLFIQHSPAGPGNRAAVGRRHDGIPVSRQGQGEGVIEAGRQFLELPVAGLIHVGGGDDDAG